MFHRDGMWIRLPWGVYLCRPRVLVRRLAVGTLAVWAVISAVSWSARPTEAVLPITRGDSDPALSLPTRSEEPLSRLFGLDIQHQPRFVLVSTVLGATPRATLSIDGITHAVAPGDTVVGAVIDSIGRRVVVLRYQGEVIRVAL